MALLRKWRSRRGAASAPPDRIWVAQRFSAALAIACDCHSEEREPSSLGERDEESMHFSRSRALRRKNVAHGVSRGYGAKVIEPQRGEG